MLAAEYSRVLTLQQDKDQSKYNQALAQIRDSIRTKIAWIEVRRQSDSGFGPCLSLSSIKRSSDNIRAWLDHWEKGSKL